MFDKPKGPSARHFKHGLSHTRIDNIYKAMISRCYKPTNNRYPIYGGRGIKVCDEWLNDRKKFYEWAFDNGYADDLTLDRIDTNKDYEPTNCRWTTQKVQQNNRRNTTLVSIDGITHSISEWAAIINVKRKTLWTHKNKDIESYIVEHLHGDFYKNRNA